MDGKDNSRDPTVWIFWCFALAHLVVWTALPMALYSALPLDSMEMLVWGQQWEWGYEKHPPLPAWIARAATEAAAGSPLGILLASQLCMVTCFWAAWRMGRSLVSPRAALLSAMLLECCLFYNYESTILNNNTVLYVFWSLAILALFRALETDQKRYWAALGVCGGLGMLTKYTFAMLPAVMLVFLVAHPEARRVWKTAGPYLAAAIALAVFSPHIHWSIVNDFPPLHWAAQRAHHDEGAWGRVLNPLEFGLGQLAALFPLVLACWPAAGWLWKFRSLSAADRFRRAYLATVVLAPFVLHLALSAAFNLKLRTIWGSHLWTFAGVLLLFCSRLSTQSHYWRRAFICCAVMAMLAVAARGVRISGNGLPGHAPRELFDGASLARQVEGVWKRQCDEPLSVIAGEVWLAGTASIYGESRAKAYGLPSEPVPPNDRRFLPGLDDRQVRKTGGLFLWNTEEEPAGDTLALMRVRFPEIRQVASLEVPYSHSKAAPARIAVALMPAAGRATHFEARAGGAAGKRDVNPDN